MRESELLRQHPNVSQYVVTARIEVSGGREDIQTGHEFFNHRLKDMLYAEQQLVEALSKQAEES